MKPNSIPLLALAVGVLLLSAIAAPRAEDAVPELMAPAEAASGEASGPEAVPELAPADSPSATAPRLGEARLDPALGRYVAPYGDGRAILTLSAALQAQLTRTLEENAVPWGATVLIEPGTGRVLAMAEHSRAEPGASGLALRALAPAASIFKLVTAAALLEQGVSPDEEVCFHGGRHRLDPRLLNDDPRRDRRCITLEEAFGRSTNVVFAKLAERGLNADGLRDAAERFLFNTRIPFARTLEPSTALIDDDAFQLANTAAGFGPVRLSPLHAALLAAIVANGGVFVPPVLVDRVDGAPAPAPEDPRRVVQEGVAAALNAMMRATVTDGTARRAFRRAGGPLRSMAVAGKTGTLSDRDPYRDYSWFVGFAPADDPQVAVATLIANDRKWRVRAPAVAREALEAFFRQELARGDIGSPAGMVRTKLTAD
ncbi:MAG TPA: penicillin-binding transpeptidase domain-containing protein [Anaeromyxobacter sp.]|nr:penicillin-binding transpeptidase domain-containing protein [Anaeromyxobacter sp.]